MKLFVCGDVMTGRGIDQVLPHPGDPRLYEPFVRTATEYVELAEAASGPIPRPVDWRYVWGDALDALASQQPDVRIVNLETAVTTCEDAWPGKGIHYRMHPANLPCLVAARIDCCTLANNHVLDWGYGGLAETLASLAAAGIATAGAGLRDDDACAPAVIEAGAGARVRIHAFGTASAGVPSEWAATRDRAGVDCMPELAAAPVDTLAERVRAGRRPGDIVVASLHWGANWGYGIAPARRAFAHALIDDAGVDLVLGHSSHHPLGIEIYRDRLVLYGCGDFVNDYEGIHGHESFRPRLVAAYFPTFDAATRRLSQLEVEPFEIRRFRLCRPAAGDVRWLARTLDRESRAFGTSVGEAGGRLVVRPA